ncbi:MAG: RNA-binding protein [Acutalibacteraceae bacterium]
MTDDQILISHARDLKNKSADCSVITNTAFLDLHQRSILFSIERENGEYVKTFYFGGYETAERVCAVFVPRFYDIEHIGGYYEKNESENPLSLIRVEKDKFSSLTHRDYLGAVMGLGIKREAIGDIITDDDGCYIITLKSAARFLSENLVSVGRGSVRTFEVPFEKIKETHQATEEISAFIASERLDNFVSAAFSLSRTNSSAAITKGIVFVNNVLCDKTDAKISVGDKVVLRGKGKTVFSSVDGKSKKGRLHITITKYL